jgi:transposase InsO family protein
VGFDGRRINRRRIERLWRLEGHRVPPRRAKASGQKARGGADNAIWNLAASRPNHIWSYDFMSGRTRSGRLIRILSVVDEFTRVALGCHVDRSIGARVVITGWMEEHNQGRLHRGLGMLSPSQFAERLKVGRK